MFKSLWKWLFFINIGRTWDGKDPKTMIANDANIVLFNHLRIQLWWRNVDTEEIDISIHILWILGCRNLHYGLIYWQVYPKKDYRVHVDLVSDISSWLKYLWNYRTIQRMRKEIIKLQEAMYLICDDPMCGCPEDFYESYGRKIRSLECKIQKILT